MPNLTPLLMEFSLEPTMLRGILESSLGKLPELEPLTSVSALSPDQLAAPFGHGHRLVFAEDLGSHHYLEQMRAVAALYLEAKQREAAGRRRNLDGPGPCLDPADHDWAPTAAYAPHARFAGPEPLTRFEQCEHSGCYAIREVEF